MSSGSPDDFFASLSVYLTLERAQRLYGFDAAKYGLDDATAAEIAAVFGRVGMPRWERPRSGSGATWHGALCSGRVPAFLSADLTCPIPAYLGSPGSMT